MGKTGKTVKEKAEAYDKVIEFLNWYRDYTSGRVTEFMKDDPFSKGLFTGKADALDFIFETLSERNCI